MKRIFTVLVVFSFSINLVGCNNIKYIKESNPSIVINEPVVNKKILFTNSYQNSISQEQSSKEQVMGWIIIDYLSPYIQKALKSYYGGYVPYLVTTPTSKILDANFVQEKSYYTVKLQVEPYVGAHDPIGLDSFTFRINRIDNKITLEKYEHIKSFKVPDYVKKQHLDLNLQ